MNCPPLCTNPITGTSMITNQNQPTKMYGLRRTFCAASAVKKIIYVSCNPEALITDAILLSRAGYSLLTATPIDQFPYSENIESVVIFEKLK